MNLQTNTLLLTILAVYFCCVAIAVEDKPAPVEDKPAPVENKPVAVKGNPAAGSKSDADGKTKIPDKRSMPTKGKNGKRGSKALIRSGPDSESKNNKYCDAKLCPAGKKHVGCEEKSNWYGGRCAIDAQLLALNNELREFVLDHFNTLRDSVARGGFSGFTEASRMATMEWDKELAHVAVFNVLKCKLNRDKCRNTAEFNNVGQSVGYRAIYHRSEPLKKSIKATINLWFNEQGKTSMDEVLKYKSEYGKVKGNFMQIVLENSNKVGCAALRQTFNGWLQTYFACNYAYSPVHGHAVYEIDANMTCKTGKNPQYESLCSVKEKYDIKTPIYDDKKHSAAAKANATDKHLAAGRVFDDTDPKGPLDPEQKKRLMSKFSRYMEKMKKSEQLAQGRKVVVITSNHEIEVDAGKENVNENEKDLANRINKVKFRMRSRPASLQQREPIHAGYSSETGISARTISGSETLPQPVSGSAKWIAI